ncbi:hypothetical protein [Photobacterium galatheae]|uniref:Uncharacterized protein n=1 Tax=Photobacterium galatheae TaxID=1654360 RepID=A0A066RZ09_9GAMM|nr:hypothetical protein [Photobacterium galatheae]KDM92932.1 hypothetical protein EA58_04035 [Photobacterium galatheae]MCM0148103.1 hypothetical protein [Photobacterium galatheae]
MNDWQEPLLGILVYCVVSLTTVIQCALSPERLFQIVEAAPAVQSQNDGVWTQLFDTTALAQLSVSDIPEQAGLSLWLRADAGARCPGNASGQGGPCLRAVQETIGRRNTVF